MTLDLKNLDAETRMYMVAEIQADMEAGEVYHSIFLTEAGLQAWDALLLEAARAHDSVWLARHILDERLAVPARRRPTVRGNMTTVKLQPENLADSEFNRYYIRGVCLRAIAQGIPYVITYRAKPVRNPVSSVGNRIAPQELLDDLRSNKRQTEHDVPSNPNSGISVQLP